MLALCLKFCKGKIVRQLVRAIGSRKIKAADTTNRDTVTDPVDAESVQGMSAGSTKGQPVCGSSSGGRRKWTSPNGTTGVGLGQ